MLNQIGRYQEVLAEVERLRQHMDGLSEQSDREESANAWNVRETLLNTGCFAAVQTGAWQQCLDLNAAILASQKARHASDLELAATRFNDYGPLLRLDRIADARRLLLDCRRVFDEHNQYEYLGRVLSALADLESRSRPSRPCGRRGTQRAALHVPRWPAGRLCHQPLQSGELSPPLAGVRTTVAHSGRRIQA